MLQITKDNAGYKISLFQTQAETNHHTVFTVSCE